MPTLLFVHIGTKYPKYLMTNIERTRRLFPEKEIILVGEEQPKHPWLKDQNIRFVKFEVNEAFDKVFNFGSFEAEFRQGYWRHTIERLFALEVAHENFPLDGMLQIESDVILFPIFPFDLIDELSGVSWMNYSDEADIATLVYSPNLEASREFSKTLIEVFSSFGGSDMDVLHKMRELVRNFTELPILSGTLADFANHHRGKFLNEEFTANGDETFPGIFDAIGIGVWVAGVDPRNRFGFTKIHTRELIDSGTISVDPSRMKFSFSRDGNLYVISDKQKTPVYNLHIHSKDKDLLSIKWEQRMRKLIEFKSNTATIIKFSPGILVSLLLINIKKGTLLQFLIQIPILQRFREFLGKI